MIRACPTCKDLLDRDGTWWRCARCDQSYILPNLGFQTRFLASPADIVIAAADPSLGKTWAMLAAAARYVGIPGFRAWMLRSQDKDLYASDGLIDQGRDLYEAIGGRFAENKVTFECEPRGAAEIEFRHLGRDYRTSFKGPAAGFLGIDEVDQISSRAFWWLFQRLRSPVMARPKIRLTINPDGDSWTYDELAIHFLDDDGFPDPTKMSRLKYLAGKDGRKIWGDSREEVMARSGKRAEAVLSVAYLDGEISENVQIESAAYEGRMDLADAEDSLRRGGRWVKRKKGKVFHPDWLQTIESIPAGTRWVRIWDLAATPEADAWTNTSYSASARFGLVPDGRIIVADPTIGRWSSGEVEKKVEGTAERDGRAVPIRFCQEHAGAGKTVIDGYVRRLVGYDAAGEVESGKKAVRLRPFVAQAERGNVFLLAGSGDIEIYRAHMLSLTIKEDGELSRPDDCADISSRGLEYLSTPHGRPFGAEDAAAIARANRGTILSGPGPTAGPARGGPFKSPYRLR